MNDELKNKVINDLEESGFSSEMKAVRAFLARKWQCKSGTGYFDLDEQKTREIDLEALQHLSDKEEKVECFFFIVGEVKKSNKPWVVFKNMSSQLWLSDVVNNLVSCENLPISRFDLRDELSRNSLLVKRGWKGNGIHESFKKPEQPSRWYFGFVSSCKAAEYTLEINSSAPKEERPEDWAPDKTTYYVFVKPVVILDGILLSAEMLDDGSIKIDEIDAAPMGFDYKTRQYKRGRYIVDVVKLESIDKYLELTEQRHQDLFGRILKARSEALNK